MSILARREDQQLQWIRGSESSPEKTIRHADYALRKPCSEVFGILSQLPTAGITVPG